MGRKKYKIKKTPKLIRKLVHFYDMYIINERRFYAKNSMIEKQMEAETGINGIEFFYADGELAGIGNADRTMELIHRRDLDGK